MTKEKLRQLLYQYFDNTINNTDCIKLLHYLSNTDAEEVAEIINEEMLLLDEGPEFSGTQAHEIFNRIKSDPRFTPDRLTQENQQRVAKLPVKRWLQIAALLLFFCAIGLFFIKNRFGSSSTKYNIARNHYLKIVPGGIKATLTLANGKVISLEDAKNGLLARYDQTNVRKTQNGQLVYNNSSYHGTSLTENETAYNTLSIPKGGEYQVTLPDGTKVWLNSASSLSFPVAFPGRERHVKLTGEAYFEVAKNKDKPFYVTVNDMQVKVLGTHFNISAYKDDGAITTTLLEGSVQITKHNKQSLLVPGQQAVVNNQTSDIMVSAADIKEAIAWKNGLFKFNDEDIASIMKKISRWYDVDVEYRGNLSGQRFGGTFSRSKSINELLDYLEQIGKIHFEISGRRVIVMK